MEIVFGTRGSSHHHQVPRYSPLLHPPYTHSTQAAEREGGTLRLELESKDAELRRCQGELEATRAAAGVELQTVLAVRVWEWGGGRECRLACGKCAPPC